MKPRSPIFGGEGVYREPAEIINWIADVIFRVYTEDMEESGRSINYEPKLIVYVGSKQLYALMSINTSDRYAVRESKFMDAKIVEVRKESYLHVVAT